MKNSLVLLAVVLSVAAFAGMMRIKTDVQTMDRERLRLVRERAELRETKRVLEAEWALLASPERLAKLVRGEGYVAASALDVIALMPAVSNTVGLRVVSPVVVVSAVMVPVVSETRPPVMGSAIEAVEALEQQAAISATDTDADSGAELVSGTEVEE